MRDTFIIYRMFCSGCFNISRYLCDMDPENQHLKKFTRDIFKKIFCCCKDGLQDLDLDFIIIFFNRQSLYKLQQHAAAQN